MTEYVTHVGVTAAATDDDVTAVAWDLEPLVEGRGAHGVDELLDRADAIAEGLARHKGTLATIDPPALADVMRQQAEVNELVGRAGSYAQLRFACDTAEPANGALVARFQERATAINTKLIWFELEWAALDDDTAETLLADQSLDFCDHHLRSARRYRPYLLSEPEERMAVEKAQTGVSAWTRLFSELTSAIKVEQPDGTPAPLDAGLARLQSPDRDERRLMAANVTAALAPGLRTRAYVFNMILLERSIEDRLRGYPTWVTYRNLANEASDASVQALVDAVQSRYDIPQRWYALKARVLGVDRIADYDRMASVAESESTISWAEGRRIVLDSYASFSSELAEIVDQFLREPWVDAPTRPNKRGGAFCAYTVPSHHPYVFLNWTSRQRDVMTLAHELGHAVHGYLARPQGIFHLTTPLTLAETASVFGETVTFKTLLAGTTDPGERFALLARSIEDAIATVFRQTAMNRFEHAVHTARRDEGEVSIDRFGELWAQTQTAMLGPAVEITDGYRSWWSYIPHFISTPGYVYAYAYGQLLALSVYRRYEETGAAFVPRYLELLSAGGSLPPEELGRLVGCDLGDPAFWDGGLAIVDSQLRAAEEAARAAGRI